MTPDDPPFSLPTFTSFDAAYAGTPPWEIGRPQPALAALFDAGEVSGAVLDAGCGTGELALLAAARGLEAIGVDTAPRAIAIARQRAAERGLTGARFVVGDVLDLDFLGRRFDTILDSGVLHVFGDEDRGRYLASLRRVLCDGGRYHVAVFSDAQPGSWGPRRVSRAELEGALARGWRLDRLDAVEFVLTEGTAQAWLASATAVG